MGGSAKSRRASSRQHQPVRQAARSHWPVVVGSFLTGVAAMTLMGVMAPTIATARSGQEQAVTDTVTRAMNASPTALIEMTEAEQRQIETTLAEANESLDAVRSASDPALERLKHLSR